MIIMTRESARTKELAIKLVCQLSSPEQKRIVLEFVQELVLKLEVPEYRLNGVGVEEHNGKGLYIPNEASNLILVKGSTDIRETLLGKQFIVPINSFFQVHTPLAELLYQSVSPLLD